MVRKNIDFAVEVVKELNEQGRNPLLLVTAAKVATARPRSIMARSLTV